MKKKASEDARQGILDELAEAASKIDEDGLMFLLRQAQTLVYNMKVDELNEERKKVAQALNPPPAEKKLPEGDVYVEQASFGKNFILIIGTVRKTMSHEELKAMVKIAMASGGREKPGARIFRWLDRHRDDVLLDSGIRHPKDPRLEQISDYLRKNFRLSDD